VVYNLLTSHKPTLTAKKEYDVGHSKARLFAGATLTFYYQLFFIQIYISPWRLNSRLVMFPGAHYLVNKKAVMSDLITGERSSRYYNAASELIQRFKLRD